MEPLVPPENPDLPDQPVIQAPRELLVREERRAMTENADHQDRQELPALRAFLVHEDRRVSGVPADHRGPKDCLDHADPPGQQGERVTKGRLVIQEETVDQEARVNKVRRAIQELRDYQEHRAEPV